MGSSWRHLPSLNRVQYSKFEVVAADPKFSSHYGGVWQNNSLRVLGIEWAVWRPSEATNQPTGEAVQHAPAVKSMERLLWCCGGQRQMKTPDCNTAKENSTTSPPESTPHQASKMPSPCYPIWKPQDVRMPRLQCPEKRPPAVEHDWHFDFSLEQLIVPLSGRRARGVDALRKSTGKRRAR